jgi:hypothetical protein
MAVMQYMNSSSLVSLLKRADPSGRMKVVLADNRLSLGDDPFNPTCVFDFASETTVPLDSKEIGATVTASATFVSDTNGRYWIAFDGNRYAFRSLKEMLKAGLILLEKAKPGTLEKLSNIKPHSKRIVAHNRNELFDSKHLVEEFSEKLAGDWWVGTNNSAQEVRAWLERAIGCAGLVWNKDFRAG